MRFLKVLLPLLCFAATSYAAGSSIAHEINERDIQAVKKHLKTKRDMRLSDKHEDLNISGDIRFEFKYIDEERKVAAGNKADERGNDGLAKGTAPNGGQANFDVEFNLYFDYTAERTWAHVHLEFDNMAGIDHSCDGNYDCGSGECDQICLRSAFMGYNIFEEGTSRLDVEAGRWDMYAIFDSRVQFQHQYDGVLLTYSNSFEDVGDFYIKGGMFVVDSLASNWGYALEVALVDIADIGLDIKYSFVDYAKSSDRSGYSTSPCVKEWKSRISQLSAAYHFNPEVINEDMKLYGAFLINHSADSANTPTGVGDEDIAFYIGLMIGGIQGEGDWAVDVNYQHVEAQAVPDFAVSGIGLGNVRGFCYHNWANQSLNSYGNSNYSGFQIEGAYALTDNLVLIAEFECSSEDNAGAARFNTSNTELDYMKLELEFMYSF